jgi:pseudo-rSAM protein
MGHVYQNSERVTSIVKQLADKSNLYCVSILDEDLRDPKVHQFILSLRENFCGDLWDKDTCPQKPIVVIPELSVNEASFRGDLKADRSVIAPAHAGNNLLSLTMHLTGCCSQDCQDCQNTFRQITWCTKSGNYTIPKEQLFGLFHQLEGTVLNEIKFIGGDVFSIDYCDDLIDNISNYSIKKSFFLHHKLVPRYLERFEIFKKEDFDLWILVDIHSENEIQQLIDTVKNIRCNYIFKITNVAEYNIINGLIETNDIKARIVPYYNKNNFGFFAENIFQTEEDILNTKWTKSEIFAHTVLNTNYFGKFTIMPNGDVHSNINRPAIGNIVSDDIKDIVNKELRTGDAWLKTRDNIEPCNQCLYKYICPSLSSYEFAIGRPNLCSLTSA